jgi:kumamolisin
MPEPTLVPLHGSERHEQPGATRIGPVPADETIQFSVVVRPRKGAPDMGEVARNAAVTGKFLSREELAEAAAPDPADVQAVEEYARQNGLTVEGVDPVTRRVKLSGSAAAVKQAFGVSLDRYEHRGRTFRGRTGPVLVPESLADIIVGVLGTDDRPMAHRQTIAAPQFVSGSSVPMTAVQMASYYKYPAGLDGTGQCIGIIEFGGGYFIQDINTYFSQLGMNTPSIVDVPVAGGSNSPTPGTGITNDTPSLETAEVELDIEVAGSAAPGASIAMYFVGPSSTNNWVDAITAAIGDSTNNPSVLSISWGFAEDSAPPQFLTPADQALASAAAAGITVLIASGDQGSTGSWGQQGPPDALAHVNFAASSPNATGVGGTVLQPDGSGGVAAEVVWNNGATTSASGGGVSAFFPVPSFQSGAGINPASANPPNNPGRGVPDVSANADSYQVYIRGQNTPVGGTSAATPLWAALIALVNQGIGGRAGLLQPLLYGPLLTAGALNDITTGDNGAYSAGTGWDACTGLGSPNGTAILIGYRAARQVAPAVTQLSESSGNPGDQLVVTGTGFLGATAVGFGAVAAGIGQAPPNDGTVNSDTQVTVTVPSGPASGTMVDVTVTAPGGASADVSADQFTFN